MKRTYFILVLSFFALFSCTNDDDFPPAPIPPEATNFISVNNIDYPLEAAEIKYLGADDDNRDVFDLVFTDNRFFNVRYSQVDHAIICRLHAPQEYFTPGGRYQFGPFSHEVESVDYGENITLTPDDLAADFYEKVFDDALLTIDYLGDGIYGVSGDFVSRSGLHISVDYQGFIYDYSPGHNGNELP